MREAAETDHRRFVCEPITPVGTSFDATSMSAGEPGLPTTFAWRETEYSVARVLETWKTTGPCRHGSGERYVRKHWFRIVTGEGAIMEIYFDRQPRAKQKTQRWWLASIVEPVSPAPDVRTG